MCHAVQGSKPENEITTIYSNHGSVREVLSDEVERDAVVGIVEYRDKYEAIGDIEVGVAGRKTLALEENGCRHGKFHHTEPFAGLVGRLLE